MVKLSEEGEEEAEELNFIQQEEKTDGLCCLCVQVREREREKVRV
jgi:hypothetical protein